ncbi:hypothetical protein Cgig2_012986 [Carnegiea gigantea]|uniref:Uncharacterized protein n=1 Tax=Carnegiea gigantea TaxID=171969 RepID=A0A9Q1QFW0_9CARY|nr:hypothetical protein Cgig2_012986 [Carnegiea gigantea]
MVSCWHQSERDSMVGSSEMMVKVTMVLFEDDDDDDSATVCSRLKVSVEEEDKKGGGTDLTRVVCKYWCPETNTLHTSNPYLSLMSNISSSYHCQGIFMMKVPMTIMFPRSLTETKPLAQEYCPLSSICDGCIRSDTFNIPSFTASSTGYCLPTTILVIATKDLMRSLVPHILVGVWAIFPPTYSVHSQKHFIDTSSNLTFPPVWLSSLSQAKLFEMPENSSTLGGACTGTYPSSTGLRRLLRMITNNLVSIRMFLFTWTSINFLMQKQCFYVTTCSYIMEQGLKNYFPMSFTRNSTFHEWWSKMFISLTCSLHTSDSKRK